MRTDKMHPLPWWHKTDGKQMSAVVDAEGKVVCGSLICKCPKHTATKERQTHAFIVKSTRAGMDLEYLIHSYDLESDKAIEAINGTLEIIKYVLLER